MLCKRDAVRSMATVAAVVACVAACTPEQAGETDEQRIPSPIAEAEVVVTVQRTPFCLAMTRLADRLETDNSTPATPLILETYREALDDAPAVIADDMRVVIEALENDLPIPTDPPVTLETLAPQNSSSVPVSTVPSGVSTSVAPDVGFNEATSPTERIGNYVGFECRGTDNNPGPPATQPLSGPTPTDG